MDAFDPDHVGAFAKAEQIADKVAVLAKPVVGRRSRKVTPERQSDFIGRPYSRWRNDPDLARMVNDRLAESAPVRDGC